MARKRRLRIASYNINGITSRLGILLRWLDEFRPDIVGLQELKTTDERFPAEAIAKAGYSAIWHGQKSWNGVALLSRVGELVETRRRLPGDPDPGQSRYIEAACCGLLIGNMYAPNGNPWPGARKKYAELVEQGWTDAIRHLHPDERIYTFWHYWRRSFERDAGIRIDHALLSPSLAQRLKAAGVDRSPRGWEKSSDHAPMWVEVEVR